MDNSKQELLLKIKQLADSGVGGEKVNAQKMLEELMKKYNISEDELCEETIKEFQIKLPKGFKVHELAVQVFYSVVGCRNDKKFFSGYTERNKRFVFCTPAEFMEFEAKYKFYQHYLEKESNRFYKAFVQANHIFPNPGQEREVEETKTMPELTEEDIEMLKLAGRLEKHDYLKQIDGGSDDI